MNPFTPPAAEPSARQTVRYCPACGADAAVSVRDWPRTSSFMGIVSTSTGDIAYQDFCCQACAHVWRPRVGLRQWLMPFFAGLFALPLLLIGTAGIAEATVWSLIIGGAATLGGLTLLLGYALRPIWVAWRGGIAPNAPVPVLRYRDPEPHRRCSCGRPAACVQVVENTTNGIPTGTDRTYQCPGCGQTFEIESLLGMAVSALGSLLLLGIAAVSLPSSIQSGDWTGMACSGGLGLIGVVLVWSAAGNVLRMFRHPVVKPE